MRKKEAKPSEKPEVHVDLFDTTYIVSEKYVNHGIAREMNYEGDIVSESMWMNDGGGVILLPVS